MGRPRTFDEAETLDAIGDHFRSFGYAGTSLDDIIGTTGLSKGSLYAAFGSKHEMFVRAFSDYCARLAEHTAAMLAGDDATAFDRLERYVYRLARDFQDPRGCLLAKATAELVGRDADIDRIISNAFAVLEKQLVACIGQAQRHGTIPATAEPRRLGLVLLASLRGMESLARGGASRATLKALADGALAALRALPQN